MYCCSNCRCELPATARFCNKCGLTQIRTILSSSTQTQQEPSPASFSPVQPPTDASSPPQQTPKRVVQPTSKRTLESRLRLPAVNADGLRRSLLSSQPPASAASSEQVPTPTMQSQPAPTQPSLWVPGTSGLPLSSKSRIAVQEQLSAASIQFGLMPETVQEPQMSEVNTVLMPTTDSRQGDDPVPAAPLTAVELLRWETKPDSLGAYDFHPPGAESIAATRKAAEHWRSSWRDRQLAWVSPARGSSRGQVAVLEPSLAMSHTLIQMQAVRLPASKSRQRPQGMNLGFWVTMILLLILLGGLGTYSISTYQLGVPVASQLNPSLDGPQPILTLVSTNNAIVTAGQTLHLHGERFGVNDTIIFVLETTTLGVSVHSTLQGTFDVGVTIPSHWLAGAYALEAEDNHTGQHAFLDIQVLPGTTPMAHTTLALEDAQGNPLTSLVFTSVVSKTDPQKQPIYLKNTSDVPLSWTSTAIADKNLGWLLVDGNMTGGTLKAHEVASVTIRVTIAGLKIGSYSGYAILTVASQGQGILPITLAVVDTSVEVAVTPNPLVAAIQSGGTCQPIVLILVNLSNTVPIRWDVKGDDPYDQQHIILNGRPEMQGSLSPSGQQENTAVLKIACSGIQLGVTYKITVYYNNMQVHVPIIIRQSY